MVSDNGCYRPTEIYTTPGYFDHGHGGIFKDGQEDITLEHYKRVAIEHKEKYLNLQKDILKKLEASIKVSNWTIKACKRDIKRYEDEIKKIKSNKNS